MKKLSKILIVAIIVLVSSITSYSQIKEVLIELTHNTEIQQLKKQRSNLKKAYSLKSDTVDLPFIDEFSKTQIFPDDTLWLDSAVYINSTLARNPLSIGVATFDALDTNGKVYENASSNGFEADILTSQPIDLSSPSDDIYISFLYQPGGVGNSPEPNDSLILQFYAPEDSVWVSAWRVRNFENDSIIQETIHLTSFEELWETTELPSERFRHAIIAIDEARFLHKGFQFRFKNYASLSNVSYLTSLRGNCDMWHIDYLRLDDSRNASDTSINDIAFKYPGSSFLKDYESIPWAHYNATVEDEQLTEPNVTFRNNSDGSTITSYSGFKVRIEDLYGDNTIFETNPPTSNSVGAYSNFLYAIPSLNYSFASSNSLDSANFLINIFFEDNGIYNLNSIIKYNQVFKNYYAYDDGSAEYGYGVFGEGTKYAQVACRFDNFDTSDTLRGVMMYFNRTFQDASEKYFYLTVWDENDTVPGNILLQQEGAKPVYDGINQFATYLFDEPLVVDNSFYVGWTKTSEETINIGFDKNRINNDKLFYNLDDEWLPSQLEGTVMIRPIFSKTVLTNTEPSLENIKFNLFPNPANSIIYLDNLPIKSYVVSIFDNVGRKVLERKAPITQLDVSSFSSGVYHVRITDFKTFIANQKLLLIH